MRVLEFVLDAIEVESCNSTGEIHQFPRIGNVVLEKTLIEILDFVSGSYSS